MRCNDYNCYCIFYPTKSRREYWYKFMLRTTKTFVEITRKIQFSHFPFAFAFEFAFYVLSARWNRCKCIWTSKCMSCGKKPKNPNVRRRFEWGNARVLRRARNMNSEGKKRNMSMNEWEKVKKKIIVSPRIVRHLTA